MEYENEDLFALKEITIKGKLILD